MMGWELKWKDMEGQIYHPAVMLILLDDRIVGYLDNVISNHLGTTVNIGWQWHHQVETHLFAEKTYDGLRQHLVYAIRLVEGHQQEEEQFLREHLGMKEGAPSWLVHMSASTQTEAPSETQDPEDA